MIILLFGATGSAGGGVLEACLADAGVTEVRAIVRRAMPDRGPKLRQFIHTDFSDFTSIAATFTGVDSCFFCVGISTTQVSSEPEYRRITQEYALAAARTLKAASPEPTFQFLSGEGASLTSRFMWARVKAETERDLIGLVGANCFRPAYIDGSGSRSEPGLYKLIRPVLRRALRPFPQFFVAAADIGRAMIVAARRGSRGEVIVNRTIREMAAP